MALWGGIFSRLQSTACEALWGVTEFSEDVLATVDHALQQGVGSGAVVVSTVINSTVSGNAGEAVINAVLNKTLPADRGTQVGKGASLNTFLNKTLPPKSDNKVGNVTTINTLNKPLRNKTTFFPPPNVPIPVIG
jgi:hypothetical protein